MTELHSLTSIPVQTTAKMSAESASASAESLQANLDKAEKTRAELGNQSAAREMSLDKSSQHLAAQKLLQMHRNFKRSLARSPTKAEFHMMIC